MKRYKCLMFDFDRTLWDVETNQKEAQRVIFKQFQLGNHIPGFDAYYAAYLLINDRLWLEYRDGHVSRDYLRNHRFVELLGCFGLRDEKLAKGLSDEYIRIAPSFNSIIPHAREVVQELSALYPLHLITNGFNEVQQLKLTNCGLAPFFLQSLYIRRCRSQQTAPADL